MAQQKPKKSAEPIRNQVQVHLHIAVHLNGLICLLLLPFVRLHFSPSLSSLSVVPSVTGTHCNHHHVLLLGFSFLSTANEECLQPGANGRSAAAADIAGATVEAEAEAAGHAATVFRVSLSLNSSTTLVRVWCPCQLHAHWRRWRRVVLLSQC